MTNTTINNPMNNVTNNTENKMVSRNKVMTALLTGALAVTGTLSLVGQTASASDTNKTAATSEVAAKRLNKLLANTKSMTANFTQKTVGAKTVNSKFSGTMSVQRPNNLRWETKSPSAQLIVANASSMWIYDKDLEQATKQSSSDQVGNTPALLLSGDYKKIAKNFKITQPYASKNYYKLYPKTANANFKSMTISYSGGKPTMMVLNDNLGQTTSIKFSNIKMNPAISASKFKFTPPAGVDVISQ